MNSQGHDDVTNSLRNISSSKKLIGDEDGQSQENVDAHGHYLIVKVNDIARLLRQRVYIL